MKGVGVLSVALAVVLAVLSLGVIGGAAGATVAAHRRAAVHRNAHGHGHGHGRGHGHGKAAKAAAKAAALHHNAFFDEMQGAPRPPPPPRAKGYAPSESDPTLSFPELDYTAVNAEPLTPLSVHHAMPTARDFRSTTLPRPLPDPQAPTADTIPHAMPAPPPHAARFMPRFMAVDEGVDHSAEHALVSPDGGALSPLRGGDAAAAAGAPHFSHSPSRRSLAESSPANAPYRQVIPIEVDPAALEAAETGSPADLMRFASQRGKELSSASAKHKHKLKAEDDIETPMALTESGPIAPYGPTARAYRFRNRPRHIFAKRVTIPLPLPGSTAASAHSDEYGPFDTKRKRTANTHNANLAAAPQDAFGGDADPLAFLQTEQRVVSRRLRRGSPRGSRTASYPSFVAEGDHVFARVDARRVRDRHAHNPHFHHQFRSEQETRDAVEADEMQRMREEGELTAARASARRDQFGHRLPRGRSPASLLEEAADAGVTPLSDLSLPAPNAPRPHAQFASPPVDVDRFDPFGNSYGGNAKRHGVPSAPHRPAPPPMTTGPRRPNKSGILLPNTFLATHARAHTTAQHKPKPAAKQQPKAKAKAAPKAAPKPVPKPTSKPAPKRVAAAKAAPKAAPKPAPQPQRVVAAPAPAMTAAATQVGGAPIEVSLLQRLESEAGLRAVAAGTVSAADDLAALRRLELAVRAAEERAELQARVEELQAQVDGLQQLHTQQQQRL